MTTIPVTPTFNTRQVPAPGGEPRPYVLLLLGEHRLAGDVRGDRFDPDRPAVRRPPTRVLGQLRSRSTHCAITVLEILAEEQTNSPEAVAIVDAALAQLNERRSEMDEAEVRSLQGSLARLRYRSISQSVRDLADGMEPRVIDGYRAGDIREFLGRCYSARSKLVHDGVGPSDADVAQLAGNLEFLLRQILVLRIDDRWPPD